MNRYTKEEAQLLVEMLDSRGVHSGGMSFKQLYSELQSPLLGCYVYPIWYKLMQDAHPEKGVSVDADLRGALRKLLYRISRHCYVPLREIPLRLAQQLRENPAERGTFDVVVLKWRLELGR
jgi:hypothetical protein